VGGKSTAGVTFRSPRGGKSHFAGKRLLTDHGRRSLYLRRHDGRALGGENGGIFRAYPEEFETSAAFLQHLAPRMV
jgi:hypothetical protein